MKIGRIQKHLNEFSKRRRLSVNALRVLLLLNECMWRDTDGIVADLEVNREAAILGIKMLESKHLIRVSRREAPRLRITRMYSITQKGRFMASDFLNLLKQ